MTIFSDELVLTNVIATRIAGFAATAPLVAAAIPALAINFEKDGGNQDGKNTDLVAGGGGASGGQKTNAAGGSLIGSKGAPTQAGRGGGKIPEIRVAGTWNVPTAVRLDIC